MIRKELIKKLAAIVAMTMVVSTLATGCGAREPERGFAEEEYTEEEFDEAEIDSDEEFEEDTDESEISADKFTLMVYICGADLESQGGCASEDINEMLYGDPGNNLNLIVQTGGAKEWQNSVITSDSIQRYELTSEGANLVDEVEQQQVTTPGLLSDFITYAVNEYPADRYGIVFWDHGGGTIGGYGCDELFDDKSMPISEVAEAMENAGCYFDFIGFDCCLMATAENATALAPYADYLIASEETEPGTGWYYTNYIHMLDENPSVSIKDLAGTIIEDYVSPDHTDISSGVTLSLIDLKKMDATMSEFYSYMEASEQYLLDGGFSDISNARAECRSYAQDGAEQIDIVDYVNRAGVDGAEGLINAIDEAVILNGTNMAGSNGLAMYYPYYAPDMYSEFVQKAYDAGVDDNNYANFFNDFVSVMQGGQMNGGGNSNPYAEEEEEDYSYITDSDWYNGDIYESYSDDISYVDSEELEITEKGDGFVLQLSEEDWDIVTDVSICVYIHDEEGYIDLGEDDWVSYDDDGDLIVDFDYKWLDINGQLVPYYFSESGELLNGSYCSKGYIPAVLNGEEDIKIWLLWNENSDEPTLLGYTYDYSNNVAAKGYFDFASGDEIQFVFDCYTNDNEYEDSYFLDDPLVYSESTGLDISYEDIGDNDTQIIFHLVDIYGNDYYTEPLDITIN